MNHAHKSSNKNISEIPNERYKELPVLEVTPDIIFPSFCYKFKLGVDNDTILKECFELKELDPFGEKYSNVGGWQSKNYSLMNIEQNLTPKIQNLAFNSILAANDISKDHNLNVEFTIDGCEWWVNINEKECYNVIHSHPGCDIIALYYPKIDSDDSGSATFVRTDGSQHISLYSNNSELINYRLKAETGILYLLPSHLLHFVEKNNSTNTRVSIAFNLSINR